MAIGKGEYDDLCTYVREQANAEGAMVCVINGREGNGFSIQIPPELAGMFPDLLRELADQVERDQQKMQALVEEAQHKNASSWDL